MALFKASLGENSDEYKKLVAINNDNVNDAYYRWCPSEWKYGDGIPDSPFAEFSKMLRDAGSYYHWPLEMDDPFKKLFIELFVTAIARTIHGLSPDIFTNAGQNKNEITFFVSMTDSDYAQELEDFSVLQMTNHELAQVFLKRYFL